MKAWRTAALILACAFVGIGVLPQTVTAAAETPNGPRLAVATTALAPSGPEDVFVRGRDGALWYKRWDGSHWSGWASLGGLLAAGTDPGAASWGPGRVDVFVTGIDHQLWHKAWTGAAWSNWQAVGGGLTTGPAVWADGGVIDVFARGLDNALWSTQWTGMSWTNWAYLGGILTSAPAVGMVNRGYHLGWSRYVYVRGRDNALWYREPTGGPDGRWESLGGILTSAPAAFAQTVFVRGIDNQLWSRVYDRPYMPPPPWDQEIGGGWLSWKPIGGILTSAPAAVGDDVYVRGRDGQLWHRPQPLSEGYWESLGGILTSAPAASRAG